VSGYPNTSAGDVAFWSLTSAQASNYYRRLSRYHAHRAVHFADRAVYYADRAQRASRLALILIVAAVAVQVLALIIGQLA
jgi:hypothetical protein